MEEVLIQRAVETTIEIPFYEGFFDTFPNADKVLKDLLFVVRRRPELDELDDVVQ